MKTFIIIAAILGAFAITANAGMKRIPSLPCAMYPMLCR